MVIVGTGIAGATAAETLRAEGFSGRIVMVGDEPSLPYRRPALSKDLLAGTMTAERALLKSDTAWTEKDIDIRSGISAETIDPERRTVALSDGETLTFEALLLATGGRAREFATRSGERIHTLRGLADTTSLRDAIIGAGSVLIVGGGLIGSEVAATARSLGTEVTILEAAEAPLIRILPPAISKMYRQLHAEHGVTMETGVSLTSLTLDDHVSWPRTPRGAHGPPEWRWWRSGWRRTPNWLHRLGFQSTTALSSMSISAPRRRGGFTRQAMSRTARTRLSEADTEPSIGTAPCLRGRLRRKPC